MIQLQVTSPCSIDTKGRVRLPSRLLKQLGEEHMDDFIMKLDRKKGIVLVFPKAVWRSYQERIGQLNMLIEKNREFARRFSLGATDVEKDKSDRLLIPKHMVDELGLKGNVVVYAYLETIEIWPEERYRAFSEDDSYDMGEMSEAIFGE